MLGFPLTKMHLVELEKSTVLEHMLFLGSVAAEVLGCANVHVELQLHSGHDGGNTEVIHSGTIDSQCSGTHTIHLYNPVGAHYDPLWFAALPGVGVAQGY